MTTFIKKLSRLNITQYISIDSRRNDYKYKKYIVTFKQECLKSESYHIVTKTHLL